MKIRQGFVSNSSSSSFVIHKNYLSDSQIDNILGYMDLVDEYLKDHPVPECGYYKDEQTEFDFSYSEWGWGIKEYDDFIFGETSMDNFDFCEVFRFIGLENQDNVVCWDDGWCSDPTQLQETYLKFERKKLRKEKLDNLKSDE